jgi:FtsH-binding integral membrane protein
METLREIVPFFIGLVLPLAIMLFSRAFHLRRLNIAFSFVLALLVGCCVSFFAGELAGDLPEALMAIIIDTSLVYTGSQAAYRLLWKPLLAHRLSPQSVQAKSQLS